MPHVAGFSLTKRRETMVPSIGKIVKYKLNQSDADNINTTAKYEGKAANSASAGDVFPAMIVRTWGDTEESAVQLQVFIDGNFIFWATSVCEGEDERHFQWPQVAR
jgi:hypothetical protein